MQSDSFRIWTLATDSISYGDSRYATSTFSLDIDLCKFLWEWWWRWSVSLYFFKSENREHLLFMLSKMQFSIHAPFIAEDNKT